MDEEPVPVLKSAPRCSATDIVSRLRRDIVDGRYCYDERLPPERNLAELFGSSRGTVRSALQQLETMNLVTRKVGSGTYIRYREVSNREEIAEAVSPLELIDVRLGLEPQIARLAVINASARDIESLGRSLEALEKCAGHGERFARADSAFHTNLVECTGNVLLIWLYQQVNEVRGHSQWRAMRDKILSAEKIDAYNAQHRAIYEAVRSRDAEGAVKAITGHLQGAKKDLLGVH